MKSARLLVGALGSLPCGVREVLGRVLDGVRRLLDRVRDDGDALEEAAAREQHKDREGSERQSHRSNQPVRRLTPAARQEQWPKPRTPSSHLEIGLVDGDLHHRVCGNPRSTLLVAGSGQREVTTLPRV